MDRARALALQRNGIEAWIRFTAGLADGGELVDTDGVLAAVVPRAPQRSILNCAVHRDAAGLERALPVLADAYERAGVVANAIWTIEPDAEAEAALAAGGYSLDAEPAAMVASLDEMPAADLGDLDWDADATPGELGLVNDLAYGYPEGEGLSPAIGRPPVELEPRICRARVEGELAAVMQTVDVGTDCLVMWVATLPEHRGRGLASRLIQAALGDARARGLATTSLQASMLGRGVYEGIGYELVASLRVDERRMGSGG